MDQQHMQNQDLPGHSSQQPQHVVYEEYFQQEIDPPHLHPQYHQATRYVSMVHPLQTSPPPPQIMAQSIISHPQNQNIPPQQMPKASENIDLACEEEVGRKSPDEFPEYVPGAWDEVRQHRSIAPGKSAMRFRTELDAGDVKLVNELGQLSVDHLLDYMKNLQNNAFLLGEEETKEFQRAKCLGIFQK